MKTYAFDTKCFAQVPYDFTEAEKKYKLPDVLNEISGLSIISEHKVACVQDEKGNIYIYHLEKEEIVKKIDFAKDGDFEDITVVDDVAYVLRSDGVIFEIKNYKREPQIVKHKTFLSQANDAEGLCYDAENHRLLIACKADSTIEQSKEGIKAVYAFNLNLKTLSPKPVYTIKIEDLHALLKTNWVTKTYEKLAEALGNSSGNITFQPSGIAIHPKTGNLYIIASAGKLLVVLDKAGKIIFVEPLDEIFKQPEGIAFYPNGDLLISNEGRDGKANILFFEYHPK